MEGLELVEKLMGYVSSMLLCVGKEMIIDLGHMRRSGKRKEVCKERSFNLVEGGAMIS